MSGDILGGIFDNRCLCLILLILVLCACCGGRF